jgi:hypothetical protein
MADYCTAAQVKGAGRLNISDTTYDTQLGEMITAASRWIDRYCVDGITDAFAVASDSTRHFGHEAIDGMMLFLDAPILTATSVTNGAGTVLQSTEYRLYPINGRYATRLRMLSDGPGWEVGSEEQVDIVGKWGLALAAATPAPITEACAMLAGWMLKRWQMALADATANQDLGSVIYGESMPKQVLALLEPYRLGSYW